MVAVTVNALYTSWRKHGTTRQLATAIVACVISALLLLPAILWFNVRFGMPQSTTGTPAGQGSISMLEITLMLVYVSLWGCVVPFSATAIYCLYTQPRDSNTSFRIPRHRSKRTTVGNAASIASSTGNPPSNLPSRQKGSPPTFVYGEDVPWGWLVHRNGRFQGLRLALSQTVVTIGRENDNDIWLDDETASRNHAELVWQDGRPYVRDCDSLNGILLNGRRMRGTLLLSSGDFVEIGAHRFLFELAPPPSALNDLDDPLLSHLRRPLSAALSSDISNSEPLPARRPAANHAFPTRPLADPVTPPPLFASHRFDQLQQSQQGQKPQEEPESLMLALPHPPQQQPSQYEARGMFIIRSGALTGTSLYLDRPQLTVGRLASCDVRIEDESLTSEQAQFSRVNEGDVVFGNGVYVNETLLLAPHVLQPGDMIRLGAVYLEYMPVSEMKTTPLPLPITPLPSHAPGTPLLRLPSKPK